MRKPQAKALCETIVGFYQANIRLPEELEVLVYEWGLDNYAINEKYESIRRICDEIMNGQYIPQANEMKISELINIGICL